MLPHLPPHLAALVEFLSLTGWRKAEGTGLTWAQVDLEGCTIRLDPGTTKSGEGRVFPFDVLPALGRLILRQGEINLEFQRAGRIVRYVFPQSDGRRIGQFHKQWRRACEAAGVVRMVHDLRRSAVRRLLRAGVNEKVAMTLCGFKTRAILDRYHVLNETDLRDALRRLVRE